ncbi:hypothetical protein PBI_SINATRA_28 [Microbacterium phage Sinatra]|jgi:hypothetical protein|uniref:Uncharacterized protein n=2 Tax=Kojivirus koji TaxID=2560594 RepID=A0A4D6E2N8_9CAUD|nr:hypothetical protein SEA_PRINCEPHERGUS_28 [Microbacterium phage PrincePhergus]QBZ73079.1 hypothetical protein SEA_PHERBOT_28 [Microbacterium phage Pherbot]QCG77934.1 hypothetical protein SEA_BUSTLETON_28 [Microbacterium phage Bustleton]QDH92756.1 hypothetical protein PBI_SINATRA_28 [Microbacterium phage Sinatra]
MSHKVNLNVHTQARAYQAGYQDALSDLVDALVEGGDVNFLIDALEMKINRPQVADKIRAYYASK